MKQKDFSDTPQTLGEHIKRARVLRGLSQPKVATFIGVDTATVLNWEKNRTTPPVTTIPAILRFLEYDPFPKPETLGERMFALRRRKGWSIKEAAKSLGVDEGTWGYWERTGRVKWPRCRALVEAFLNQNGISAR